MESRSVIASEGSGKESGSRRPRTRKFIRARAGMRKYTYWFFILMGA